MLYPAPEQQNDGKFKLLSKEDLPSANDWERPSSMLDELRTRIVYKHQDGSGIWLCGFCVVIIGLFQVLKLNPASFIGVTMLR